MPVNTTLVNIVSDDVHIIKDTVEYHWYVGCTPTAVAMVMGYWDRNGYDNLIFGDSATYSDAVRTAIAGPDHLANIYDEDGYDTRILDASEGGRVHNPNSIADYLLSSRSALDLNDGWTLYAYEGVGVHGYAMHQGYDDFSSTHNDWGTFTFNDIVNEIDAGRPIILAVDADADNVNDHNVVVFGFDKSTNRLLIHDGWDTTEDMWWIDFAGMSDGQDFGIVAATFVTPGDNFTAEGTVQFLSIQNDGSGTAASYRQKFNANDTFYNEYQSAESFFSRTNTLAIASEDGHTFYQLYQDGNQTDLYEFYALGNGEFNYRLVADNSQLGTATLDFATADGETFYQLVDDGAGTAALYELTLDESYDFSWTLLNANSGLSLNTLSLATADGVTFTALVNDGSGTAASYSATLNGNGSFSATLLVSNSGVSNATSAQAGWANETPDAPPAPAGGTVEGTSGDDVLYGSTGDDKFFGFEGEDVFVAGTGNDAFFGGSAYDQVNFDGQASDYTFSNRHDGAVKVFGPDGVDVLKSIEGLWFTGEEKWYRLENLVEPTGPNIGTNGGDRLRGTIYDDEMWGKSGRDVFIGSDGDDRIDGGGSEYDQVDYGGSRSEYSFVQNSNGTVTVSKPDGGTDTLSDIDGVWFNGSSDWASIDSLI